MKTEPVLFSPHNLTSDLSSAVGWLSTQMSKTALAVASAFVKYPDLVWIVPLVIAICLLILHQQKIVWVRFRGRLTRMSTHEETVIGKHFFAKYFTEAVEEAVYQGKMTRKYATDLYRQVGNVMNNPELLPKGSRTLKSEIKDRLPDLKKQKKPAIPGDPPGKAKTGLLAALTSK